MDLCIGNAQIGISFLVLLPSVVLLGETIEIEKQTTRPWKHNEGLGQENVKFCELESKLDTVLPASFTNSTTPQPTDQS